MKRLPRRGNLPAVCFRVCLFVLLVILLAASFLEAQGPAPISAALREKVDAIVRQALTSTGVPSVSIAIVQGGAITYVQAYGEARIAPYTPANVSRRVGRQQIWGSKSKPQGRASPAQQLQTPTPRLPAARAATHAALRAVAG